MMKLHTMFLLLIGMAQPVFAEPGYRWQMTMEMDGMAIPGMGGGSTQCVPARGNEAPGMDEKCTLLESKQTGNRYRWTARCDGALTTGDFTFQGDSAYKGTLTVEEGRERMTMRLSGKRLDKCDYTPPKIAMPDMTANCDEAVRALEPGMVFGNKAMCGNRKADFCARLGSLSPEAFGRMADRIGYESQKGAMVGSVRMEAALKSCSVKFADLRDQQCRQAVSGNDCDFIQRYCLAADKARCAAGRTFSGRSYTAQGGSAGQSGPANPLGEGLNKLKGLFSF